MPTTWTPVEDVVTVWELVVTAYKTGGWGDSWGLFPWGVNPWHSDFTLVNEETGTEWTLIP